MQSNSTLERVFNLIKKDIEEGNKQYSILTNTQISKELNSSAFTVRDKVLDLVKKKHLLTRNNVWIGDKYHNRIIYLK